MSATALPLPLELTKPITLAADLDTQLRESLGVGKYDPKMQISTWLHGSFTKSNQNCNTSLNNGVVVIDGDVQIDDNL
jgi:hypothetical protein